MSIRFIKQSGGEKAEENAGVQATVARMLAEIEAGGEIVTQRYAERLDGWTGEIVVPREVIEAAADEVPQRLKDDIRYAHDNIAGFARAQLESCRETEVELRPGLRAGQRLIPIASAGAYVPGGRYSHIASALMTVTTAKVAGVGHISAVSPPRPGKGIPAPILYALDYCGADRILALGGVQGVAAMAFGQFGLPPADILVGPGNAYVAEAKRQLFGRVGIDMFAGPTDSMVIADGDADPHLVAWDLVGQAEHGQTSPVWLVTDSAALAEAVTALIPACIAELPQPNRGAAEAAWADLGEIVLCDTREEMAEHADRVAPEHLHVQAADLPWWRGRLSAYGSLFLGPQTTVAFGDKAAGTNHVLPTSGAARYTGGLSVHKFLKTVTWQEVAPEALRELAAVTARISRYEGMEGHARSADIRLEKFFPGEAFVVTP
ncbi:histidinol dehydrogenase [Defluviimonas sp. WL0024]|uniref:Histidinol dehydrogenase n=2 Tax=Albidovulum TaxID=205889 RepID=A0ABT3IXE0_9RHOB|nr:MULTISPECIES: histidinol dehydrogenase [Defluviimonas]MCU9846519.1 histidinol dehydrogenase [Defluviimonas sp. WL0024]MCW3780098.1 histidinol dehydrogenase [Defluviimonas salinarum]